jgi:peptidylprolyl isomerase
MKWGLLSLSLFVAASGATMSATAQPVPNPAAPAPGEIVAAAPAGDWRDVSPDDLLVMTLAPDAQGRARTVVIQLMPAPFSQNWVANIRTLARARWFDGIFVMRVQDNYVVQWGDPDGEDAGKAKPLPPGLKPTSEAGYSAPLALPVDPRLGPLLSPANDARRFAGFVGAFPFAGMRLPGEAAQWPVHCYGSVGVGRGMSPDAGTGAELYTVIGQAPRQLDRNIAVVGRIVEGMEHLSSLPRGTGALGFYEKAQERTPISAMRLASDLPAGERPRFQYLATDSDSFLRYADARANRRDPFLLVPAGGADICNIPVPTRRTP